MRSWLVGLSGRKRQLRTVSLPQQVVPSVDAQSTAVLPLRNVATIDLVTLFVPIGGRFGVIVCSELKVQKVNNGKANGYERGAIPNRHPAGLDTLGDLRAPANSCPRRCLPGTVIFKPR